MLLVFSYIVKEVLVGRLLRVDLIT